MLESWRVSSTDRDHDGRAGDLDRSTRGAFPVFVCLCAGVLAVLVTIAAWHLERGLAEQRLEQLLDERVERVAARISLVGNTLVGLGGHFVAQADDPPDAIAFGHYHDALRRGGSLKGVQALGLARLVSSPDEPVRTRVLLHRRTVSSDEEPRMIGAHNVGGAGRGKAIEKAVAEGGLSLSMPAPMGQDSLGRRIIEHDPDIGGVVGAVLYLDLGKVGLAYAALRMPDLFASVDLLASRHFALRVSDAERPDLTIHLSTNHGGAFLRDGPEVVLEHEILGRTWQFAARDVQPMLILGVAPITGVVALASFLLVIMVTVAAWALAGIRQRERALVEVQQHALSEKDFLLHEMSHRLKNMMTRVTAIARQAARGPITKEELVSSMTSRLQGMAAAQDLVLRADRGRVSLAALVEGEIAQLRGNDPDQITVSGAMVELDAAQTQALGLALHELATNALKYGAVSNAAGRLSISWSIITGDNRCQLRLVWSEQAGHLIDWGSARGFGYRLMTRCVEDELSGELTRELQPDGIEVVITFPLQPPAGGGDKEP